MEFIGLSRARGAYPPVPGEGNEDHRVLQPLAAVDGDDLYQVPFALQAQLVGLLFRQFRMALMLQPLEQPLHAEVGLPRLPVQQFGQVPQIGQPPLAVGQAEQTSGHLLVGQQLTEHGHESAFTPLPVITLKGIEHRLQPIPVPLQPVGVEAKGVGAEGSAQQAVPARFQHRRQQPLQLLRLAGVEHVVARAQHAEQAPLAQSPGHHRPLAVAAHQHRDIAAAQGGIPQPGPVGPAPPQQARDLIRRCRRAGPGGGLPAEGLFTGLQQADPEGTLRPRRILQPRMLPLRRQGRWAGDARIHKGGRVSPEQGVDRVQQRRHGAPVDVQGEVPVRIPPCRQVGIEIGTAEAVDRLFRITHQVHRLATATIEPAEDVVLHRIGVLELVDQGGPVAIAQRGGQPLAAGLLQCPLQIEQQIVVALQAALALAPGQLLPQEADQLQQQGHPGLPEALLQPLTKPHHLLPAVEEGVGRGLSPLLDRRRQGAGGEPLPPVEGCRGVLCRQPQLQRLQPAGQGFDPVEVALQAIALEQQPADGVGLLPPQFPAAVDPRQVGPFRLLQTGRPGRAPRFQVGPAQDRTHQLHQPVRVQPLIQQVLHQARCQPLDPQAPEVVHQLLQQFAPVRQQFLLHRQGTLHRAVAEHPLAEAMDGEDHGPVEIQDRQSQAAQGLLPVLPALAQRADQRIVSGPTLQHPVRLLQPLPDPAAQLGGGCAGIGDHQDLLHRQPPLHHQPQVEGGDGVGLAGAGAGLDQGDALQRGVGQVQPFHLTPPPWLPAGDRNRPRSGA